MKYTLRDYQGDAVSAALKAWGIKPWYDGGDVFRSIILNLATSAGKTIIAAALVEILVKLGGRCLFVADTDELCAQAVDKFHKAAGILASVEKAGDKASLNSEVVVASAQSLGKDARMERFPRDHFDFIFHDESHRGSHRAAKINEYFNSARTCGITATAFRMEMKDLSVFYETVAYELGTFDLIGRGYAPPIRVVTMPVKVDISTVRQSVGADGQDYNAGDLGDAIEPYFASIIEGIKKYAPGRQILTFLPLIATSQKFVKMCLASHIDAKHIDGTSEDRDDLLKEFSEKKFQLLSNASLLSTGWDCHSVDCLLNLRPTRSVGLFRQMAGRIIRVLPGVIDGVMDADERKRLIAASAKPNCLILDPLWQVEKFKLAGASSLIAMDEKEAAAIDAKIRETREDEDIQDIVRNVQLEAENALKSALQDAQLAAGILDARAYGYLLHEPGLMDYIPVTKYQQQDVTDEQRKYLTWARVNPETVHSFGQAKAILDINYQRKRDGMAPIMTVFRLSRMGIDASKMTIEQADAAVGVPLWTLGKKAGTPMNMMPNGSRKWWKGFFADKPELAGKYPREYAWANGR